MRMKPPGRPDSASKRGRARAALRSRPLLEELEPRLLLSADLPGAALDPGPALTGEPSSAAPAEALHLDVSGSAAVAAVAQRRELVVIDAAAPSPELLIADLLQSRNDGRQLEFVILGAGRDGVAQISEALAALGGPIDALHIISHGSEAGLRLGDTWLTADGLAAHAEAISGWREALSGDADLLLYGCDLAAGAEGRTLIEALAKLSGADVAASSDATGSAALGGDWELELARGSIETDLAFSSAAQASWEGVLDGTAIWAESGTTTPETNSYGAAGFGTESNSANVGEWRVIAGAEAPSRDEKIVVGVNAAGSVTGQRWNGSSWSALPFNALATVSDSTRWGFGVAYESQSGDAMLVWNNGTTGTAGLSYRTWDGSSWSSESTITTPVSGEPSQLRLAAAPDSDEMVLVVSNAANDDYALVWNGSSWGNSQTLDTSAGATYNTDVFVAYEQSSGDAMVTYGTGSSTLSYRTWNGTSWSSASTLTAPAGLTGQVRWSTLGADPNSDRIALGVRTANDETWLAVWDGSAWGSKTSASTGEAQNDFLGVAVAFESSSGDAVAAYSEDNNKFRYRTWTSASGWSAQADGIDLGQKARTLVLSARPGTDQLMLAALDSGNDASFVAWDGRAWGAKNELETNTGELLTQPLLFLWDQNSASSVSETAFWLSTAGDVTSDGGGGLNTWTAGEALAFGDPDLELEPVSGSTSGTLAPAFDLDAFGGDTNINSLHYVTRDITVGGANAIALLEGDLLLSTKANETLTSNNSLSVAKEDIFVFRPQAAGDYSAGTFLMLLDNLVSAELRGITLVEQNTVVGDTTLQAGDFLFLRAGGAEDEDVWLFETTDVGTGTTSGTASRLLDGADANVSIGQHFYGIDLLETATTIGGHSLAAGTILLATDANDTVGSNNLSVTKFDIFAFSVTQTTYVAGSGNGAATATLIFQGADVGLTAGGEDIAGITTFGNQPPVLTLPGGALGYTENDAATVLDGGATVSDSDSDDFDTGTLTVDFTANGSASDRLAIRDQGAGVGNVSLSGSNVRYDFGAGAVTVGTYTGGSSGSDPLVVTFNSSATATAVQAVVRNVTFANVSDAPSTAARTLRFVVTDGEGGTSSPATKTVNVTAVNDAPVLVPATPALTSITENDTANGGDLVSAILASSVSDVDSGAVEGIAITSLTSSNGTWQYKVGAGAWTNVGAVSSSSALLLAATDRVRFVPDALNSDAASFTYRAWDQTSGTAGTKVDASSGGGTTAFSSATDTASITVTAVNDAPVLVPATPALTSITEDDTSNGGDLVSALLGASVSDVDSGAVEGIAITGLTSSNGTWQYKVGAGAWTNVGAVSSSSALLLAATDRVRFVPDAANADAASFSYRAWDQSTGTAGTKVDASTSGGTTAFSSATDTASITVTAVNDAPVLVPATPALTSITENDTSNGGDLVSALLGASVSDVDSGAVEGIAITSLTSSNGTWQYKVGAGAWTDVGAVSSSSALLLAATDRVRFVPDALNSDAASFTYRAWDQTSGTAGTKVDASSGGGTTAFSSATDTASISITAVNDAAVLTPASPSLASITENDTSNGGDLVSALLGASVSDVDSGAVEGIAITSLTSSNGTWQYKVGAGAWTNVGAVSDASALLLAASDRVRFVPDAANADAASFSYRAWDQSAGTAGTKVDASTSGGTTAFSSATDTASITVTAVNDAPVLVPATPALTSITEDDTSNGGDLVSALLGASVSDVDSGAVEGIAITSLTSSSGTWQYKVGAGAWTNVGTVSSSSALLLAATDRVRFVPNALNSDAASFTYRAWDQSSGTAGTKVDASSSGGTTAFSSATDTASITVTAVNDAPVLVPAAPALTSITENDTSNGGDLVSALLGASVSDVDSGAVEGIAITALSSSNGTWQYKLGAGAWTDVGAVADSSALLLAASDRVRFVPDALNSDAASFSYRAWDQSTGSAGTKVDASTNGGTSAFSTATDTASITVTAVNDAPVLVPATPALTSITENDTSNGGDLVSALLGASVSDVDSGAVEGIAITGLTSSNGTWQYKVGAGAWTNVGAVSDASALLLAATDRVRFVPDALNADAASFSYRAWDQSSGSAGTQVDASTNGGTTAFSSATDSASITVTAVNDAPVLVPATPALTTITEDDTSNGGDLVSALLGASVSDVDSGAVEGIAITSLSSSNGTWQYKVGAGAWTDVGAVSDASALLLAASDRVRFVPDALNTDAASFSYRGWDQTSGSAGSKVDASTNGGTTAFSSATDTASISVTAVNDAPVLTPASPSLTSITENDTSNGGDLVSALLGASVSDVDSGAVEGIAITGLTSSNGTWQYKVGAGAWTDVGAVADSSALLLAASDRVRFVPDALNSDAASFSYCAWDQSTGSAGTKVDASTNGGTSAFSTATDTASITVTAANDAPVLTPATPALTTISEDDTSNGGDLVSALLGASVSDVDSGAVEGIAITGLSSSNGTWQYKVGAGAWTDVGAVADSSALLLAASDRVRFVPDGLNADAASFTYRAWDQTSGTAGTQVDASTSGGTTAFASATDTASITVTAVNDAPVLDASGSMTLANVIEDDADPPGDLVSTILGSAGGDRVTDADSGALEGVAVTGVDDTDGTWEYSTNGGGSWLAFGAVTDSSAVLLDPAARIRFVPDLGYTGSAGDLSFRAWDQSSGSNGQTGVDVSTNGGTTAFSGVTETATTTVIPNNAAPVLTPGSPTLATIDEDDTGNAGDLVSTLIGASITDADPGALQGIAITSLASGNGTWQYQVGAGAWTNVGAVSSASALLLADTDRVRFVPDAANADAASFTYRAWDQTSGTAGTKVDTSLTGGSKPFSLATDTASITVTAVNDAPALAAATPTLTAISEDDTGNAGDLVSAVFGAPVSDVDSGAVEGIAITSLTSSNGTWQYKIGAGAWTDVGAVSDASALLLAATDRIRFVPDGLNADAASFSYRGWDQTSGTAGSKVDASTNGGTSAFSSATDTGSISVTAVNDAPVLTPATPTLTTITEDETSNAGDLVSALLGGSVADVDSGAVEGIAITALTSSNGTWQYKIGAGAWTNVGAVSDASALLLAATDRVRFVPDGVAADAASFSYRAWDQSSGTAGTKVDVSSNGGTAAFSSATDTASITVTGVNDAPVISVPASQATNEDSALVFSAGNGNAISVADVDAGSNSIQLALVATNGTLSLSGTAGLTFLTGDGSGDGSMSFTGSISAINAALDGLSFAPTPDFAGAASVDVIAGDLGYSGAGGAQADSETLGITVNPVNDAPVLVPATPALTAITEDDTSNGGELVSALLGASVSDVDSGAVEGIAITGLSSSNGTWQYKVGAGAWTDVGAVSDASALLLAATDRVRFVPDAANADAASFTYRAWDQSAGTAGTQVDASTNGGTSAFSTATDSASITVTALNDAPVLVPATPALTSISEDDTSNAGDLVSALLGGSVADVDSAAVEGIAITSLSSSNGTWQYKVGAGAWTDVGAVSNASALLLTATDRVRFVPDGLNSDAASFTYRAWDQSAGTAGTKVDASSSGGTTAFSTATDTASISVTAVNDAPVLTPATPSLTSISEDDTANAGDLVSALLGASVADVDTGALEGIAITSLTSSNGTWQYKIGAGAWTGVGAVSDASALLLAASDRVRFVPDGLNSDAASFTYRAWDQSSGTAGTKVDVSSSGGTTAFSSATDTASITVTAVNDAPVLTPAAPSLTSISEDDTANAGDLVSALLGASIADVDSGAVEGIAITGLSSGNGTWQYKLGAGAWANVGVVTDSSALLLAASDRVRFVPDGLNADAASFTYRAWDQSSGTAGSQADASTNGGTTAFASATDTASITVTAVNDSPVLAPAAPSLTTITEDDTANAGDLVSALLGASVSDVDSGAVEGIAITSLTSGNGTWQYKIGAGAWTDVGAVASNSALLLAATDRVRFVPDGLNSTAASFTYRAWDQSSGTAGTKVDASSNGGTTAFSSATDTASITVTAVNDAPVLTPATPALTSISEDDTSNAGDLVSALLGASVSDVDSGAVEGIAITGLSSGNGTWQYKVGAGAWTDVGAVSDASALLLAASDRVRFVPDGANADAASFSYRAWDQSSGSAGTQVDASSNGGTTGFSSATDTASITVTAVNDAPVLVPATPSLTSITEDDSSNGGDLVSALLGASVSDVDSGALEGIAITGLSSSNGTWQYKVGAGAWTDVGAVSDASALLLAASDRVRFVPDGLNSDAASFTYRAWDQSSGTAGTQVDASTNGNTTAFSSATDTASITVTAVNDAPVLVPATPALTAISEDDTSNGGELVSALLGASVSDVDSGAVEGIAITGLSSSNGTWQYKVGAGAWTDVGAVSDASALLLAATDRVRFVPDAANADAASFTYRAWDQSAGTAGSKVDASTNGGTSAFSTATDSASITVTALNDAPVLVPATPALTSISEDDTSNAGDLVSALLGGSVADVDSAAVEGIAITSLSSSNGTWQYKVGAGAWTDVGAVSNASALLLTATDRVRFVPDGLNSDAASFTYRAWDQSAGTAGTKVDASSSGGTTAFSTATDTASISVTAVNDAPVLTPATPSLTSISEDDTANAGDLVSALLGASVADVDTGALEGIAITSLTSSNGTWQYKIGAGAWTGVGAVSDASALLLAASDRVRFVPDGLNSDAASFTYRAWDQSSGTAGTKVDVSSSGGTTAFSSATDTASITVTAVNDAPVLTPAAPSLTSISEDDTANAGDLVSAILGASFADVDSGAVEGIAITGLSSGNGTWQYKLGAGAWANVGVVTDSSALLLAASDRVRFVPDGLNADAASFTYRAWDQSSGTAGSQADASTNGGTTAFASATDTASITVTAVNDSPVLAPAAPSLTTITEDDTANAGDLVSALLGASVSDVDSGAVEGIAITSLTSGNGTWQYKIGAGAWTDVGAVASNSALLLAATDRVRFVPDGLNSTAASFTYRAWDQSSGTAGTKVDASSNGGTTAFSSATDTASITVTAVNDAPVLTPATPALTSISEDDTSNAGDLVSALLGASVSDVDSGAVEGIAITGLSSGNGTWQYKVGAGAWTDVGAVSDASALLLAASDRVRFVPDALNSDAASFTYRAWDQSSGSAGTQVDASSNGGTTGFSSATDTASITVTAVNDAPVLVPATPSLTSITEDDTSNAGDLVSALLGASVSDVDSGALEGIAITGLSSGNGTWQYKVGAGAWTNVGAVSDASALLLAATDRVRFVPDGLEADAASITYRAWDQTSGTAGTQVDVSTNGGTTAFSTTTDTASIAVTAVNDAPVLAPAAPSLTTISEDDTANAGDTVASLLGASVSDVDSGAVEGVAITGLSSGNGTWQYQVGAGAWTDVGTVSDASALLLAATDRVRFVPDGLDSDSASFTYRAWDQTSDTAGSKVDVSSNGGTTAFSSATDTASISVSAVNDAPVLTPAAPSLTTISEDDTTNAGDTVASLLGASVSDVDSGALEGIAITGLSSSNGTWQYRVGAGAWTDVGAVSDASALLLAATDRVRFVPDGLDSDSASFSYRAWDQSSGTAGTKVDASTNGGTTAFSTATDTASITVTAANDAPVLSPAAPSLTTITEDDAANAGDTVAAVLGASVADVDSGAVEGIAITALSSGNGTWQYQVGAGAWTNVGAVSNTSALLLAATDGIRFVPDGLNADAASFTYRAWDQSAGTAGTKVDASSNGGSTAFSSATDTASITATALNDAPSASDQTFLLGENAPNGSVVGSVQAVDVDLPADTLTWSITAGDPTGIFAIDPASGQITLADASQLDFETQAQYVLTVQVQDSGTGNLTGTASVSIDLADAPEVPILPPPAPIDPPEPPPIEVAPPDDVEPPPPPPAASDPPPAPVAEPPLVASPPLPAVSAPGFASRTEPAAERAATRTGGHLRQRQGGAHAAGIPAAAAGAEAPLVVDAGMWQALERMSREMSEAAEKAHDQNRLKVLAAEGGAASMAAGFLAWFLRGGTLLTSLLSSLPAWSRIDPLPVLVASDRKKRRSAEDEKREALEEEERIGRILDRSPRSGAGSGSRSVAGSGSLSEGGSGSFPEAGSGSLSEAEGGGDARLP